VTKTPDFSRIPTTTGTHEIETIQQRLSVEVTSELA
jgi:hypothetical protein